MLRFRTAGERCLLAEADDPSQLAGLADRLARAPLPDVSDFVPAERTILVHAQPGSDLAVLRRQLSELSVAGETSLLAATPSAQISIPVRYDGPDLGEVARLTGRSTSEVIRMHCDALWHCDFIGFAPGFSYLTSQHSPVSVPRREQSRARVPAGSVALAGRYSAVYPRASPGGWQLIGSTDAAMWDLSRDQPALVAPGALVRFIQL